jgi:hypothetical protein
MQSLYGCEFRKVKDMAKHLLVQVRKELGISQEDKLLLFNFGGQVILIGAFFHENIQNLP